MIDIIDIDEVFSAGDFSQRALQIIVNENQIGNMPVIVG